MIRFGALDHCPFLPAGDGLGAAVMVGCWPRALFTPGRRTAALRAMMSQGGMSVPPDLGRLLHEDGFIEGVELHFYDVPVAHVTLTADGTLSTALRTAYGDQDVTVALDFQGRLAEQLVASAPGWVAERLQKLAFEGAGTGTVQLDEPIVVNVQARLGPLIARDHREFAPLIVRRLL